MKTENVFFKMIGMHCTTCKPIVEMQLIEDNKPFKEMIKEDILAFLDSIRRPETEDPTHNWIGTYNKRLTDLLRFFKWLYSPDTKTKSYREYPSFKKKREIKIQSQ